MAYVTYLEYQAYNTNSDLEETEFDFLSERASEVIDILTHYRIVQTGIENFTDFIQEQIKKAVNSQIDTIYLVGSYDAIAGDTTETTGGFTIGKYSESGGSTESTNKDYINGIPLSPLCKGYLSPTGLTYASHNWSWS